MTTLKEGDNEPEDKLDKQFTNLDFSAIEGMDIKDYKQRMNFKDFYKALLKFEKENNFDKLTNQKQAIKETVQGDGIQLKTPKKNFNSTFHNSVQKTRLKNSAE